MDRPEADTTSTTAPSRWAAELKFLASAAIALLVLIAALIAEALWGTDAMAAIILTAVALALLVHYGPRVFGRQPRTH